MTQINPSARKRIDSIDILRGLIMIIMALDHTRDFFHISAMTGDPTDPLTTTPFLFFTRWITHFCAPVFVFLAGTSAFLSGRKRSKKEMSVFLLKRGFWLLLIDIFVFNLLFSFDPAYHFIGLQVIWVTGCSMILLSVLLYLPIPVLMGVGLVMVGGHNLLDRFNSPEMSHTPLWWGFLHQQVFKELAPGRFFGILYPLIPWPGIMLLGYCMGSLFVPGYDAAKRRSLLVKTGLAAVLLFFVIRGINIYGDLVPWKQQNNLSATVISFFNVTKYPPSLLYCLMTIGPALIVLACLEKIQSGWASVVVIYGRVPMFYYLLHFLLLHLLCVVAFFATGHSLSQAVGGMMLFRPVNFGFRLEYVYLIWIAVVAMLYPLCKKYSRYKATQDHWWLGYL